MAVIIGTGSIFLALTLTVNVIALLVPYWVVWKYNFLTNRLNNQGLWGRCECQWGSFADYVEDLQENDQDKAWFMAVKSLYTIAVVFILIGMMIVFIVSCCTKAGRGVLVAGVFLMLAFVLITVSLVLFGVMGMQKWELDVADGNVYGWGFWLAVAGGVLSLLTSIIYIHQGRGGAYALVES